MPEIHLDSHQPTARATILEVREAIRKAEAPPAPLPETRISSPNRGWIQRILQRLRRKPSA